MLTIGFTERRSGVPLTTAAVPTAPVLANAAGENRIDVAWSLASGSTSQEQVELRAVGEAPVNEIYRTVSINWGDGGIEVRSLGSLTFTEFFTHTYTGAGPFTITVQAKTFEDTIETEFQGITPNRSANYLIDQVQLEKYEDRVLRFAPDWKDLVQVPTSFADYRVFRGFLYEYRIRFRTVDARGAADVISKFSNIGSQGPWT